MALDLVGIDNRGEFYSHHYLDALLESDLKPLLSRWTQREKDDGIRVPWKRLNGLAGAYFEARSQASEARNAPDERLGAARDVHARLLEVLGYQRQGNHVTLESDEVIPLVHEERRAGRPALWVVEMGFPLDDEDPLDQPVLRTQLPVDTEPPQRHWRELVAEIFRQEVAPTWVLVLGGSEVVLGHRAKWGRGKALAFDLDALFARRQPTAWKAMAALLHHDALVPGDGISLHESLDESSHKHAFGVSTDLREGAEQAIEILGNEAATYLRTVRKEGVYDGRLDPDQLTRDCLVFLYRLIFLFYVEARSDELGVAPMGADAYRRGYSLESLRQLELVPLTSPQAQDGYFLHDSLNRLFKLVNAGYPDTGQLALGHIPGDGAGFRMRGLHSRLFDDDQMPVLRRVRLRNAALQQVIALLSLSKEGKHKQRGRISYASLGINQLGAVYEGLLSYTGFFAQEDLLEVANAKENGKPDARTFFVPLRLRDQYDDAEIVRDGDGRRVVHSKGTYLYRLAGRDREKSASYYTPEVLTRCLVKYTLKERLEGLDADAILELTVCEPAMGSGAFLNEAVNQLAEAYLQRKQDELGRRIRPEHYASELQRVRGHIAARNCYGVDLNPLATELGKVSLWLNVLRPGGRAPFFDPRIHAGNSLVGARRAWYSRERLHKASKKEGDNWLKLEPQTGPRAEDGVYQFLLFAEGMADFAGDKVVRGLAPEACDAIKAWKKTLNRAHSAAERARLVKLSQRVDALWDEHVANRKTALAACTPVAAVWPEPNRPDPDDRDEAELAKAWAQAERENTAGRRLQRVLDAWCALWFWPLSEAESLPSRAEWLDDLDAMLAGRAPVLESDSAHRAEVVRGVAERHRFVHWEHAFPEVFDAGGFDVVVGNPPWLKLQWNEGGVLSDLDPRLEIRRLSAKQTADLRKQTLVGETELDAYVDEFQELAGQKAFLNSVGNYALLLGVQTNLYKGFLVQCWRNLNRAGSAGLLHQTGILDDPKGGVLRRELVQRLRLVVTFINQLKLFSSVANQRPYAFTVCGSKRPPDFRLIANVFHPRTIEASELHDGAGSPPGLKTPSGEWALQGHNERIVQVDGELLALFRKLHGEGVGTPPLPALHAAPLVPIVAALANSPTIDHLGPHILLAKVLDETPRRSDGTIVWTNRRCEDVSDWIVQGPHFFVATPMAKEPQQPCTHTKHYDPVDLMALDAAHLPITNYSRGDADQYVGRHPQFRGRSCLDHYRHVHREMVVPGTERTLVPALIPPGVGHLHHVFGAAFQSAHDMAVYSGSCSTICADFIVKACGAGHINTHMSRRIPVVAGNAVRLLVARTALMNCITSHYAELWTKLFAPVWNEDRFTRRDVRLSDTHWTACTPDWTPETPLRTPYARRQALVELDALAAIALGLTADELCLIYRVQFPVLQQYEADTWYDRRGRIVFTNNRGLNGVGIAKRKDWESIKHAQTVDDLPDADWTYDALGRYEPPFDRCDREADMRQAYEEFVRRGVTPAQPE